MAEYRIQQAHDDPASLWQYADAVHLLFSKSFSGKTIGISRVGVLCELEAVGIDIVSSIIFKEVKTLTATFFEIYSSTVLCVTWNFMLLS